MAFINYIIIRGIMKVKDLVDRFDLNVLAGETGLDKEIKGGHCGDLLSEVMGNAIIGSVWLTVQGHQNIVAVAVLREMAAIIVTGVGVLNTETIDKAEAEGITILRYSGSSFELAGKLYAEGLN